MGLHTILGAESVLTRELAVVLRQQHRQVRTVAPVSHTLRESDNRIADPLDYEALVAAIAGSEFVYLLEDLTCRTRAREEQWPALMRNTMNACKESRARLIYLDSPQVYGKTNGPVNEQAPYRPQGPKAHVHAQTASLLQEEMQCGSIRAVIARASEAYGPGIEQPHTIGGQIFSPLSQGKCPWSWHNPEVIRSYSFLPDLAGSLYLLASEERASGQVWHLPAASPPVSLSKLARMAAEYMNSSLKLKVNGRLRYALNRWLNTSLADCHEYNLWMDQPFELDSSRFTKEFRFLPTSYSEGIRATASWFMQRS